MYKAMLVLICTHQPIENTLQTTETTKSTLKQLIGTFAMKYIHPLLKEKICLIFYKKF